ncbi:efflux RND transporter periplasmic adaptor subunit [Pseudooceanicola aestuarii]|uniref:efflux RND transporter periplasmic adaptor subunit n=1 Tax=Pseudooceanicola aestuarii TaxID=2697319 RepID=UPI001EF95915|nr:efflux RND transporter periplasmic adaptor subunit [Pseudooceanicola aestuarii]
MNRKLALAAVTALVPLMASPLPGWTQTPLKPVKTLVADSSADKVSRQFFGQVVARQTVDLAFQVGGQLVRFPVIEGATLSEGDLVAQLDLETFQLSLDQATLQRDQAQRTLDRLKRLEGRTTSQVSVDDATTQLQLAEVAVRNAEYALKHATLSAPFDALVAAREVANFTTISAGTPVVRLHDMSEIRIEVDIPEVLLLRSSTQEKADLNIEARFPFFNEVFPLEMREFNAETTRVGQSFRVTLAMDPPEDVEILPGASATVTVALDAPHENAIRVPKPAVFIEPDGTTAVMEFTPGDGEEGTLTKRSVKVAPAPDGSLLVTEGLTRGTEIVAAGGAALEDGQAVRRFAGFGN